MLNKELKVNDYLVGAEGDLYQVVKVLDNTYQIKNVAYSVRINIHKDGTRKYAPREFFHCTDVDAHMIEYARKKYEASMLMQQRIDYIETLIGQAKYFLDQIKEIQVIPPEDDYDAYEDDYDYDEEITEWDENGEYDREGLDPDLPELPENEDEEDD